MWQPVSAHHTRPDIASPLSVFHEITDGETRQQWRLMLRLNEADLMLYFLDTSTDSAKNEALTRLHKEMANRINDYGEFSFYNDDTDDKCDSLCELMNDRHWFSLLANFNPLFLIPSPPEVNPFNKCNPVHDHGILNTVFAELVTSLRNVNIPEWQWDTYVLTSLDFINTVIFKNNCRLREIDDSIITLVIRFTIPIAKLFAKAAMRLLDDSRAAMSGHPFTPRASINLNTSLFAHFKSYDKEALNCFVFDNITSVKALDHWAIAVYDFG